MERNTTRSAAALLAAAALAAPAAAQCDPDWVHTPGFGFTGTDGTVFTSVMWDPDGPGPEPEWLVVGGMFSAAGSTAASALAAYDGHRWRDLAGGVSEGSIFDRVSSLAVYDGMLIVGGHFAKAGELRVANIAAFDGADWHALGAGVYGGYAEPEVMAMAVLDGKLVAAGAFTHTGDGPAAHVAEWDGTSWSPLGAGTDFVVLAAAAYGGDVYIGGQFRSAGGVANTERLARWDGNNWHSVNGGVPNGIVHEFLTDGSDLIVGGQFGVIGGIATAGVARWDGTQFHPFGDGVRGIITGLETFGGELHVGGGFTTANGAPGNNTARWDGTQWRPLGDGVNDHVWTLTDTGGELFAGGRFREAEGEAAGGVAWWDGGAWSVSGGRPLDVLAGGLGVFGEDLIIAGYANFAGGNRLGAVVRFDGLEFTAMGGSFNELPWAVAEHAGELYAAGWFTQTATETARGVARWDGAGWRDIGADLAGGYVTSGLSIGSYGGDLIIGGDFTSAGGVPANHIARYDGHAWHAMGAGLGNDYSFVWDIVEFGGDLVAVGYFPERNHAARWDGAQWHDLGTGLGGGTLPEARSAVVFEGDLIVAGEFTHAGGAPSRNIARWDGAQWHAMDAGAPRNGVSSLAVYDGVLYAGAQFHFQDDPLVRFVAWDGAAWQPVGGGLDGAVGQLQPFKSELVLSGSFSSVGGVAAPGLARWSSTNAPWFATQPSPADACLGDDVQLTAALALGYEHATLRWRRDGQPLADGPTGYGSTIAGATTPTLTIHDAHAPDGAGYDVVAETGCAPSVSDTAGVTICIADFDCSGGVDTLDVLAFLNAWSAGDTRADLDGNGQTNTLDVLAFLNAWGAGC